MKLLIFGYGYSARFAAAFLRGPGVEIVATVRSAAKAEALAADGISARLFSPEVCDPAIADDIAEADAILVSVPPGATGDPVLAAFAPAMAAAAKLRWIGYLSTIGVYGDHGGGWVDETTPVRPAEGRSRMRAEAEQAWLDLGAAHGKAVHLFRLAGIYGPGRNQLAQLAAGTARRIVKPGQVFNRIHVADIATVIAASLARPRAGAIYNVTDDEPAPPQDVVSFAAGMCGMAPPPEIAFEQAEMTPMARSFYGENKRVRNGLIKRELDVVLRYPSYREGLTALRDEGPRLP